MPKKEKKSENLEQELGEYKLHLQRLQADFENYIKRTDEQKNKLNDYLQSQVLEKFLTVADEFELTLQALNKESKQVQEAINMLFKNFTKVLHSHEVKPFESLNKECDPLRHEVIQVVDGEEDNIVIEELRKGYTHKETILRPAVVKASRKCIETNTNQE